MMIKKYGALAQTHTLALARVRALTDNPVSTQCLSVDSYFFHAEPRITFHFSHMYQPCARESLIYSRENSLLFHTFLCAYGCSNEKTNFIGKRRSFRATMCAHTIVVLEYIIFIVLMVRMRSPVCVCVFYYYSFAVSCSIFVIYVVTLVYNKRFYSICKGIPQLKTVMGSLAMFCDWI